MDASAARLLYLVLFSAVLSRAEVSFSFHCVTFSIHDLRGQPRLLTPSTMPCRIIFCQGAVLRDVAEQVQLVPGGEVLHWYYSRFIFPENDSLTGYCCASGQCFLYNGEKSHFPS